MLAGARGQLPSSVVQHEGTDMKRSALPDQVAANAVQLRGIVLVVTHLNFSHFVAEFRGALSSGRWSHSLTVSTLLKAPPSTC
jgi:hypothetical protein